MKWISIFIIFLYLKINRKKALFFIIYKEFFSYLVWLTGNVDFVVEDNEPSIFGLYLHLFFRYFSTIIRLTNFRFWFWYENFRNCQIFCRAQTPLITWSPTNVSFEFSAKSVWRCFCRLLFLLISFCWNVYVIEWGRVMKYF